MNLTALPQIGLAWTRGPLTAYSWTTPTRIRPYHLVTWPDARKPLLGARGLITWKHQYAGL